MNLEQRHIDALDEAETLMFHSDFCPYLELKELLSDPAPLARRRFRLLFTSYYGLNVGGLTDTFKDRFFEILFSGNVSFVSKLVAMHRESSPIYDRHVLVFFGKEAPAASVPKQDRIGWYVGFLRDVASDYARWALDSRVSSMQLAAEQDSSVPMAKRMDFKTAFRTAYKDLQLTVDEIKDERPGSSRL